MKFAECLDPGRLKTTGTGNRIIYEHQKVATANMPFGQIGVQVFQCTDDVKQASNLLFKLDACTFHHIPSIQLP